MVARFESFVETTRSATSKDELTSLYLAEIRNQGYQNAVFARTSNQRLISVPWDCFPKGYLDNYKSLQWDKIDPVIHCIHKARRPFRWSEIYLNSKLNRRQRYFLEECRELGVHSGITIPLHCPGLEVDLISLSLRDEKKADDANIASLHVLTAQYWFRLNEFQEEPKETEYRLTSKELECLCWCKEGKTNWEIGEIMSISEKTVEFHLSNVIRKLGVSNRITAVVKAIQQGVIAL